MNNTEIVDAGTYSIFIGEIIKSLEEWLTDSNYSSYHLLIDKNIRQYCLPLLKGIPAIANANLIEINPGESYKTIETTSYIWQQLINNNTDRQALFINLGGGVITDMGGFAASTYKRGIDFIHIPTTLLSMADASVGGKTGIDFQQLKNAIGVIQNPKAVFVYPPFLRTLPHVQILSGYAEMIKHALISNAIELERVLDMNGEAEKITTKRIAETIKAKLSIVNRDFEDKNVRRQLNFGHTIGHALESWLLQKRKEMPHGICVAAGMIVELYLSEKITGLLSGEREKLTKHIIREFPRVPFDQDDIESIITLMRQDKKNKEGNINFVLLKKPGELIINEAVNDSLIKESLAYYLNIK